MSYTRPAFSLRAWSKIMIDVHCHILPAVDFDGPRRLDEVLEMARIAVADGIHRIVATPHVSSVLHTPDFIREQVENFNGSLRRNGIDLEVLPGAEVSALLESDLLNEYTLNGSDYVLLEFPHSQLPQNARQIVFNAFLEGVHPIIPHPERNPSIVQRPELAFELVEAGALLQVTAESLIGGFGPEARECAMHLLRNGMVHMLATDAHSPKWRRPILSEGLRVAARVVGEGAARNMVEANPAAVIAGESLNV